jgi:hypothetical protein
MDLANQLELEQLYNKNQLLPRMRKEFMDEQLLKVCVDQEIPYPFALDLLAQIALHRRANVETMVGLLAYHFKDQADPYQACADMLWKCVQLDFLDWHIMAEQFVVRYDVSEEAKVELERFQYPLPFVVPPMHLKKNIQTGYYAEMGSSVILKQSAPDNDVCLEHLNRLNRMKLRINSDTARMVKNQWKKLDRPKTGETQEDYERRLKAFEKYDRVSRDVMEAICMTDDKAGFWLTHRYDKRGRTYAQGHHVQYQGTPWNKAVVEFYHKELVQS